jgi:hypothetical protein
MNKSSNSSNNKQSQLVTRKTKRPTPDGLTFAIAGTGMPKSAIPKGIDNKVYNITQSFLSTAILTTSTTVPTFGAAFISLSLFDQVTQLAAVFDQYRIKEVEIWTLPRVIQSANAPTEYATVIDYDDSNNLTSYQQACDYQNCVETSIYQGHYRRFQPHAAIAAYGSSVFTSFGNVKDLWIDAASTGVAHYGLKLAAASTTTAVTIDLIIKCHFQFRNVR